MPQVLCPYPPEGLFWHVHHSELVEWCRSYPERESYIHTEKARQESSEAIELRLRLFKPVQGKLSAVLVRACASCDQAWIVHNQAWIAYSRTNTTRDQARTVYDQAYSVYYQAWIARNVALCANRDAIEALHKKECRACPWDGETIFPRR